MSLPGLLPPLCSIHPTGLAGRQSETQASGSQNPSTVALGRVILTILQLKAVMKKKKKKKP